MVSPYVASHFWVPHAAVFAVSHWTHVSKKVVLALAVVVSQVKPAHCALLVHAAQWSKFGLPGFWSQCTSPAFMNSSLPVQSLSAMHSTQVPKPGDAGTVVTGVSRGRCERDYG